MAGQRYNANRYLLRGLVAGSDFSKAFVYYPQGLDEAAKNWTGWTGQAQLRVTAEADDVALAFEVTLGADGSVLLVADAEETSKVAPGKYAWDLRVAKGTEDFVLMGGSCSVAPGVTR